MSKGNISKKQEEILEYIKSQILQRGFPPAVREICDAESEVNFFCTLSSRDS